ncbi:MAG: hypothetical protein ACOC53_05625 [Candidatus Saliniplasma sp.]
MEKKEKLKITAAIIVVAILFLFVSVYLYLLVPVYSPPRTLTPRVILSVESEDEVWEISVDGIEGSLSSLSIEEFGTLVWESDSEEFVNLTDIRDTWCDDWGIMWHDIDDDGMLSVGDTIVISKEGGETGRLQPGVRVTLYGGGYSTTSEGDEVHAVFNEEITLPDGYVEEANFYCD